MNKMILHIPHSSTIIPDNSGYVVNEEVLKNELKRLTDWFTNELFYSEKDITVKADFSRLFCDVERFIDDEQEVMASVGMGVLYSHLDSGELMREVNPELRKRILNEFYIPHHKRLTEAVEGELARVGKALIVDCHSFPKIPLKRALDQRLNRPDFNIGTDPYHTPSELVKILETFLKSKGFSVGLDWPYSGSIVPLKFFRKEKQVHTVMIEVNRRLYLDERGCMKNEKFDEVSETCNQILSLLRVESLGI
ncbi:N-formylglutamate amidohydrolase [Jiulongibacter sediminis]|uniref:N-formylglutamate amidohydrolase n=1 Tax=Jiulongibacter sediminis TaxID=1605367 RepID=A0A0P7C5G6_9BACT|nr:N-formylglutamate amidohydrolase [Jiulongibacter sediminis]KPM50024.1 hypothetical protein AFM12_05600 [Jiulongibacter sediminis]TBX27052.1 hypothetical protein TK44_05605 [Jiulongibacter sediminis]